MRLVATLSATYPVLLTTRTEGLSVTPLKGFLRDSTVKLCFLLAGTSAWRAGASQPAQWQLYKPANGCGISFQVDQPKSERWLHLPEVNGYIVDDNGPWL